MSADASPITLRGWALVLGRWGSPKDFIVHPFFYFFNSAVFLCALILARKNREAFLRITVEVVFFTIVVQVIASFFYRADLYRGQVFFNMKRSVVPSTE